jgi:hypothetical protein
MYISVLSQILASVVHRTSKIPGIDQFRNGLSAIIGRHMALSQLDLPSYVPIMEAVLGISKYSPSADIFVDDTQVL